MYAIFCADVSPTAHLHLNDFDQLEPKRAIGTSHFRQQLDACDAGEMCGMGFVALK